MGAVGGQIEPYYLSKVMGTSTCDMMVIPKAEMGDKLVRGICGQVDGSILPGMIGLEAGQSAFGDTYAWYKNLLMWPVKKFFGGSANDIEEKIIPALSDEASKLPLDENSELAVDWLNGRRTPDANQELTGAMMGLDLASDAPRLFRSWVEATCFGAKAIVERFNDEHVPVKGLIGLGGVARKSPYIMQVMADVMNMPIKIHRSEQTCAMGAAMFAATAAGIYPTAEVAMNTMGQGFDLNYKPDASKVQLYAKRYQKYLAFGSTL
jgi:L-ribulokinase